MTTEELERAVARIDEAVSQNRRTISKLYDRIFGADGSRGISDEVTQIKTTMALGIKILGAIGLITMVELAALLFRALST